MGVILRKPLILGSAKKNINKTFKTSNHRFSNIILKQFNQNCIHLTVHLLSLSKKYGLKWFFFVIYLKLTYTFLCSCHTIYFKILVFCIGNLVHAKFKFIDLELSWFIISMKYLQKKNYIETRLKNKQ